MPTTLAEVLAEDRVDFGKLEEGYNPVLNLVDVLIGVVPNCDPYLEIWPPGFRTYNLIVPNFLNLPQSLIGRGAPKDIVGLGLYASSRAADCMYCSAHTCSFALRRGSSAEAVTGESRTAAEAAAVAVAEALSTMPHHYTPELGRELQRHFSDADTEWIVMGVAMMGFLNKFMDAIGVELEDESINDVSELISPTGWSIGQHGWANNGNGAGGARDNGGSDDGGPPVDSLGTLLKVFRNAPGAVRLERGWMADMPKDPKAARHHVANTYGFDEPLLTTVGHSRIRRALATVLRHNLDTTQTEIGIGLKALVGLVFARHAGNAHLVAQSRGLATHAGVSDELIEAAAAFRPDEPADEGTLDDHRSRAALTVAHRIAPSPAQVDSSTIAAAAEHLSSAETVEIAVWVSILQLIHRLSVFYGLDGLDGPGE